MIRRALVPPRQAGAVIFEFARAADLPTARPEKVASLSAVRGRAQVSTRRDVAGAVVICLGQR